MSQSTTYYTISQFINGAHTFTSDIFTSKKDAERFLDSYTTYSHDDIDYAIFKCKTRDVIIDNSSHQDTDNQELQVSSKEYQEYDLQEDLTSMTIEDYGKGYLLRCSYDDERCGEKYFLDGWWKNRPQGWFFRAEFLSGLLEMGAEYISDEINDGYEEKVVCGCDLNEEEELHLDN